MHPIGDSGFYRRVRLGCRQRRRRPAQDFSSNLTATMTYQDGKVGSFVMGELGGDIQALATADDPAHAAHRKLLVPQLAARRIRCARAVHRRDRRPVVGRRSEGGSVEWMAAMANRLPMMIVGRLIGVPDGDIDQLMRWGYASTQLVEGLVDQDELAAAGSCRDGTPGLYQRTLPAGRRRSAGQSAG